MWWIENSLDIEKKEGSICGYITNARKDMQLTNYLEEQRKAEVVDFIQKKYEKIAILKNMYVEEDMRGEGVGTSLLKEFLEKTKEKKVEAVVLVADTGENNDFDLVKWYEGYGFYIIYGEKTNYPVMIKEM